MNALNWCVGNVQAVKPIQKHNRKYTVLKMLVLNEKYVNISEGKKIWLLVDLKNFKVKTVKIILNKS